MNENTSNKTNQVALGLAILLAIAGFVAAGFYSRHSQRLQVRLDAATTELQQAKSDLERVKSEAEKTAGDLAGIRRGAQGMSELETARLKVANLMAHGLANDHPAVRELTSKISELQK